MSLIINALSNSFRKRLHLNYISMYISSMVSGLPGQFFEICMLFSTQVVSL